VRVLWARAPFVLRRHPAVLVALLVTAALAGLAAASSPFVRAGVRSESLRGQVRQLSPLAVGFEVQTRGRAGLDASRRAAAARLGRSLPSVGPVVATSMSEVGVAGSGGNGTDVVAMARTGALRHVGIVSTAKPGADGVWISTGTAQNFRLRPGGTLPLTLGGRPGEVKSVVVRLPVAGVYRALDGDLDNPYWANFVQDIRPKSNLLPLPPAFVFMNERTLLRVARALKLPLENRFEYPVDPSSITYTGAVRMARRFAEVGRELPRSAPALGCRTAARCTVRSSLDAALIVAASNVAAVAPTITLVTGAGLAIAFALTLAAGVFLVRRRADEANLLYARGESPFMFASRSGLEALLPTLAGVAIGFGAALVALRAFAAAGTIDHRTIVDGAESAALAGAVVLVTVAAGAFVAFPHRSGARLRASWAARVPWELLPLVVAGVLAALVLTGHGLAHDVDGRAHPTLALFLLPVVACAGVSGLAVRAARGLLRRRFGGSPPELFLAARRLAGARALLVAVVVSGAVAFGTFAYALTLTRSLERSAAQKALITNGSDVQGYVDPLATVTKPFPFPVAIAQVDALDASLPDGRRVDVVAGDPSALGRTILWHDGWPDDLRPLLPRLREGSSLAAIATPGAPATDAVVYQGARIPVHVVGHADIPGSSAGRPALLVSSAALRKAARRAHVLDPGPGAVGLLWARGSPAQIVPALDRSDLSPVYVTTPNHIRENGSVVAAERSYEYVRVIGAGAGVLSLLALLLYLGARQRTQLIATALARRMGLSAFRDAAAVALEAGAIVLVAAVTGALVAVLTAIPLIERVDPLPLYAPKAATVIPWATLAGAVAVATAAGATLGAAASVIAAREDVAEALRVA